MGSGAEKKAGSRGKTMSQVQCLLCGSLALSDRRIISPRNSAYCSVREFFLESICPKYEFTHEVTYYVCRLTCYRKLERAVKLRDTLHSLVTELKSLYISGANTSCCSEVCV